MDGELELKSEASLIRGLVRGEEKAFAFLVEKYRHCVHALCLRYLKSASEAEDIAQEVFIEVFEHIKLFKQDAQLKTWILSIARNKCLDAIKYKTRTKRNVRLTLSRDSEEFSLERQPVANNLALERFERTELRRALSLALDSLNEKQRSAIVLSKLNEYRHCEISERMGVSISCVESLIFRAKGNLKQLLQPHYVQNQF